MGDSTAYYYPIIFDFHALNPEAQSDSCASLCRRQAYLAVR